MIRIKILIIGVLGLVPVVRRFAAAESSKNKKISDAQLIQKASQLPAQSLLSPRVPVDSPKIPLRGTIEEYIRTVVRTNGVGDISRKNIIPCSVNTRHTCVEIVGEACPASAKKAGENCEGMSMTVRIDMSDKPVLDSADSAAGPNTIRDQSDVEHYLEIAP